MKKQLFLICLLILLSGCAHRKPPETTASTVPETTAPTVPETVETEPVQTEPAHSPLYIPGVSTEDMILYFQEVCLDAEIVHSGDPTRLQKWVMPIRYRCEGPMTEEDSRVLWEFVTWLNTVEGFPGMEQTEGEADLRICFRNPEDYLAVMGPEFSGTDGAVTFWYDGADQIYEAIIGCRTDLRQQVRNSVILEEIYNGLGPVNDTVLRQDSIIYSEYTLPQSLTEVDRVILQLLYHPRMLCGMDGESCAEVIRQLYY